MDAPRSASDSIPALPCFLASQRSISTSNNLFYSRQLQIINSFSQHKYSHHRQLHDSLLVLFKVFTLTKKSIIMGSRLCVEYSSIYLGTELVSRLWKSFVKYLNTLKTFARRRFVMLRQKFVVLWFWRFWLFF